MTLGLAELGSKKRLDEIPCDRRPDGPAAHTQDIHVIVFDPLLRGEVIVNERRPDAPNLVRAHRRADAAATDRYTAIHLTRDHCLREWNYVVGIVIAFAQAMSAKIYNFMTRRAQLADQFLLQTKSTVIGGNPHAHILSFRPSLVASRTGLG